MPFIRYLLLVFFICTGTLLSAQKRFLQRTDYQIQVKLDDKKHFLHAHARITYHNNSSDTLSEIIFHLWPNAYKDRNTSLSKQHAETGNTSLYFSEAKERGYIDSLDFRVNNIPAKLIIDSVHSDVAKLVLNSVLMPGDSVVITTPFRVKIPDANLSRLGHNKQQYLITQWYPKPAVYDQNGWHGMPYLDMGEFYSEFGSFSVSITLPENYVVAATGLLRDSSERAWLLQKSAESRLNSIHADSMSFPLSSTALKTITYSQDSIHDFAFFADKRYLVLHDTLRLSESGKIIDCFGFFTPKNAVSWKNSIQYLKEATRFYSERVGEYPFGSISAADGLENAGVDMEYPMITVLGSPVNDFMLEDLIVHEVGHNWFYGILGNNERRFPWMDEGMNTAFEIWYMDHFSKKESDQWSLPSVAGNLIGSSDIDLARASLLRYRVQASTRSDQQCSLHSEEYTTQNYGSIVYYKTGILFNYLRTYLGDSVFTLCSKEYYRQWSFNHPEPGDMQFVFEKHSGEKLDWFFHDLMQTNKLSDSHPELAADGTSFVIRDKGDLRIPVPYTLFNDSNYVSSGFAFPDETISTGKVADKIVTGNRYFPEVKTTNNISRSSGLFRNSTGVKFRVWPLLEENDLKHTVTVIPVPAWNTSNGFMLGAAVTNISVIPKKFEYQFTPLYDFTNATLAGTFGMQYHMYPKKGTFGKLTAGISGKRFGQYADVEFPAYPGIHYDLLSYNKLEPSFTLTFRKKDPRSNLTHGFNLRNTMIWQEEVVYKPVGTEYVPEKETAALSFNEFRYQLKNTRTIDPFSANVTVEQAENHIKTSLEFNYKLSYARFGKGVRTRLFAGYFAENSEQERNYNFRMSGWSGSDDYKYDNYYFGRNEAEGLWNKQFLIRDGGFITPTAVGQSNEWIASVNIHADIPSPLPFKFFLNIGTYKGIKDVYPDIGNTFMYDGGLCISAGYDLFEIYFPLFYSKDIDTNLETNDIGFKETIRFVLNINQVSLQNIRDFLSRWI